MKSVSVIVPIYGVERYIESTIQSVLKQTYQDFELLLIDDESPDQSLEICQKFKDSRIKIISQKNRGLAGARNTGIRHAEGEYLAFLDGDDLWLPEKLEKHINHLKSSSNVGLSFSRSQFINESGDSLNSYLMPRLKQITASDLFKGSPIGNGSASVIRREVLEAIKFQDNIYGAVEDFYFDEQFRRAEDIECWLRIAIQTSWQIEGLSEALTLYRVNAGGLSASLFKQLAAWEQVVEKTRSYAPELTQRWENVGRAHQLQILARSAVRLKAGSESVTLINRSISSYWRILLEEPRRILLTLVAAYMLRLLPKPVYHRIEGLASKVTGKSQRSHISKEQTSQTA